MPQQHADIPKPVTGALKFAPPRVVFVTFQSTSNHLSIYLTRTPFQQLFLAHTLVGTSVTMPEAYNANNSSMINRRNAPNPHPNHGSSQSQSMPNFQQQQQQRQPQVTTPAMGSTASNSNSNFQQNDNFPISPEEGLSISLLPFKFDCWWDVSLSLSHTHTLFFEQNNNQQLEYDTEFMMQLANYESQATQSQRPSPPPPQGLQSITGKRSTPEQQQQQQHSLSSLSHAAGGGGSNGITHQRAPFNALQTQQQHQQYQQQGGTPPDRKRIRPDA